MSIGLLVVPASNAANLGDRPPQSSIEKTSPSTSSSILVDPTPGLDSPGRWNVLTGAEECLLPGGCSLPVFEPDSPESVRLSCMRAICREKPDRVLGEEFVPFAIHDSRSGEPTWPKAENPFPILLPFSCCSFCFSCCSKMARNREGDPAMEGDPTLLELPLGMARLPDS